MLFTFLKVETFQVSIEMEKKKSELGMEWRLANQQFLPQGAIFPNCIEYSSVLMQKIQAISQNRLREGQIKNQREVKHIRSP